LNKFKNVSFVDFMLTSRILVTLEVWKCSIFVRKCTAINTKRSGEMADVWQIGEIRWNKQNLLYYRFFIRRLNG
jgi:hypothetical protein